MYVREVNIAIETGIRTSVQEYTKHTTLSQCRISNTSKLHFCPVLFCFVLPPIPQLQPLFYIPHPFPLAIKPPPPTPPRQQDRIRRKKELFLEVENHWRLSQAKTHPKRSSDIRTFSVLASASSTSLTTSLSFPSAYPRQLLSSCEYKPSREILLFHSRCNKTRQKSSSCFVPRYPSHLQTPDLSLGCYRENPKLNWTLKTYFCCRIRRIPYGCPFFSMVLIRILRT